MFTDYYKISTCLAWFKTFKSSSFLEFLATLTALMNADADLIEPKFDVCKLSLLSRIIFANCRKNYCILNFYFLLTKLNNDLNTVGHSSLQFVGSCSSIISFLANLAPIFELICSTASSIVSALTGFALFDVSG